MDGCISWKQFIIVVIPAAFMAFTLPVSIATWLVANHADNPHKNTVTMDIYMEDIRDLKQANRELQKSIETVRRDIQAFHTVK